MAIEAGDIEKHRKYLATVPSEVVREQLQLFRLKDNALEALPLVCQSLKIKKPYDEFLPWMHPLDPVNLDDLKNWFGVPNETAKQLLSKTQTLFPGGSLLAGATQVLPRALPMRRHYEFGSLDQEERLAVKQTANNLLHGYVDPGKVSGPPFSGVIEYMITAAKTAQVTIFVAPDLIVCPGKVVEFQNIPALLFNNILIYGNGKIVTKGKTKIRAYQIRHIA